MSQNTVTALDFARLKDRVALLEKAAFSAPSEFVEGWTKAAKLIGVTERTIHTRLDAGAFPAPCRVVEVPRTDGKPYVRPVWRRKDLLAYAEGEK